MNDFVKAIQSGDISAIRAIPKSDLHNHSMMGGRHKDIMNFTGKPLRKFRGGRSGINGINDWIRKEFSKVFEKEGAFEFCLEAAFLQALDDGVTRLEMSVDSSLTIILGKKASQIAETMKETHMRVAPGIDFLPEIGLAKTLPLRSVIRLFEQFLETGYFRSVDIYDVENAQPLENFVELYKYARLAGMKCKAHAGEFGNAEYVRKAVEILNLDAVQHGIGAATSPEVMAWLAERDVQVNVCPESNIRLKRAQSYETHPIRKMFDHGVRVTINTDDVLLFDEGNSEQYLKLYQARLFSAEELDQIRMNGLNS